MKHHLAADGIILNFGSRRILSDIYIKCATGEITGILGRNGHGKSCLLNIIYGSLKPSYKSVRFDDQHVAQAFLRPDLLTYLPQFNFIPGQLSLKRVFSDFGLDYNGFVKWFSEFEDKYEMRMKDLSGGQRRVVEVYVIVKSKSLFSMLDEPFSHLMPLQIEKVNELIIGEKVSKGFIITDHNFRYVTAISHTLYVLREGKMHLTKQLEDIEWLGYARL